MLAALNHRGGSAESKHWTDPFDYPGYPVAKDSLDKRFDTEFRSFKESRKYRYDSKGNRITE